MKKMYLADNHPKGNRHLLVYALKGDGTVSDKKVVHDFGTGRGVDGMTIDTKGNVYATAGTGDKAGVYVFSPEGKLLTVIKTPETPTNCCFGGKDRKWLYVTAGVSLYRIHLHVPGFAFYWPDE
jgi:gluconolactonase